MLDLKDKNWSRDFRNRKTLYEKKFNVTLNEDNEKCSIVSGVLAHFNFHSLKVLSKWESAGICIVASWNLKWDSLYHISITFCVKYFLAAGQEVRLWEWILQEQHRFLNRRIKTLSSHHPPTRVLHFAGVLIADEVP